MKSTKPFPETIQLLLDIYEISGRELARRLERKGISRNQSTVQRLVNGESPVNHEHLEWFAKALGILPETFAEYRLWKARSSYDPLVIGWPKAIKNLELREASEGAAEPLPAHEVADRQDSASDGGDLAESA